MDGEDEANDKKQEEKLVAKPLKTLLFCERMKKLLTYCLTLKELWSFIICKWQNL